MRSLQRAHGGCKGCTIFRRISLLSGTLVSVVGVKADRPCRPLEGQGCVGHSLNRTRVRMSTRVNMGGTAEPGFVPWGQGFFDGRKTRGGCMFQGNTKDSHSLNLNRRSCSGGISSISCRKPMDMVIASGLLSFSRDLLTANGRPGVHHIEARVIKDVVILKGSSYRAVSIS